MNCRCDSFVVETNVHYPTDINLLLDSMTVIIREISKICEKCNDKSWRQNKHIRRKIKRMERNAQELKRYVPHSEEKKIERENLIKTAHQIYIDECNKIIKKVKYDINELQVDGISGIVGILKIEHYMEHADKLMDQIKRRVIEGKVIPHDEKIFSVFEEHTEWICKGKSGKPQELGLKVCIVEDQHGFILNHRVMIKETDDKVAVQLLSETKEKFQNIKSVSFDKGFHNKTNKEELKKIIEKIILPRKGKQRTQDIEEANEKEYKKLKRQHSAVESGISALENHGLDRCLDHGLHGFKRYVGLAVLSRNIQIMGKILIEKLVKMVKRKREAEKKAA